MHPTAQRQHALLQPFFVFPPPRPTLLHAQIRMHATLTYPSRRDLDACCQLLLFAKGLPRPHACAPTLPKLYNPFLSLFFLFQTYSSVPNFFLSILCLFQAKIFYFWQSLEHTNIYSIDYEKYSSSVYTQAQICPNRWYVVYLSGIVYICMLLHFFQKRRLKITHVWFWINLKWGRILTDCLGW